ncbi:MAG: thiamine phosphate synthase, partial [Acidobacteriota bacterium]
PLHPPLDLQALEQVERLIAGGATLIQIREKHASSRDFYEAAAKALEIARKNSVKIIINDRVDIALALKADGVHLGQDDLPCRHARQILGETAIIGVSTHSFEQAFAALLLPINYIAIGPIFSTTTKENADPAVGLEGLSQICGLIADLPPVAIGGINASNLKSVLNAGADSAAIIGDLICNAEQITEKMKTLLLLSGELNNKHVVRG